MAEQPELDLPSGPPSAPKAVAVKRKTVFAGFTKVQIIIGGLALLAIIWCMWVTKALVAPKQDHIVSARLSSIVGEYVQGQARSASPPAQVESEMRTFMATLDSELQRRSANGQVVLVGEAVLTKNVPDITDSLKAAVYASGIARPKPASAEDLQRLEQLGAAQLPAQPAAAQSLGPAATIDPMAAAQGMPPQAMPVQAPPQQPMQYGAPGASVSTFGGPDGNGGQ
ncbi:TrbI F-type domain-containing protein [Sphingobium sp. H39-3-25]|uniref:TrbI F-type domain-containing protein n=1 Tax=Sphingobium arseniciresistens TaxID=3030834 RepID=UPI0023BA3BDF|nr:TrbI F-type domain-containing protein [Sphingobium arseniciresistens]